MEATKPGNYVVTDRCHANELFPEPGRSALRTACHELLGESGPCLVILTPGQFLVQPLQNGADLKQEGTL